MPHIMNQKTILSLVAISAIAGILVTGFSIIILSANADSSTDQSAQKYDKKCDKATEKESGKKGVQADSQYERHAPDVSVVCTSG
jgi:hypothetical protein